MDTIVVALFIFAFFVAMAYLAILTNLAIRGLVSPVRLTDENAIVPVEPTDLGVPRIRINWEETWMEVARTIAKNRSADPRLQVCALIVTDDNAAVLALGYNGGIAGGSNQPASSEPGKSEFLHAELNACFKCPFHHPRKKIMYVTVSPCKDCARAIANCGISKVIYDQEYRDLTGVEILRNAGVEVIKLSDISETR